MIVDTTVCTLIARRDDDRAVANLITALNRQSVRPDELVIDYLQHSHHEGPPEGLPEAAFRVKTLMVPTRPGQPEPRGSARNRAAMVANGRTLVFVEEGAVPGPDLVRTLDARVTAEGGCVVADARRGQMPGAVWRFADLWEGAGETAASDRNAPDWTEGTFAVSKLQYLRLGGFAEAPSRGRNPFVQAVERTGLAVQREARAQVVRPVEPSPSAQVA